MVVDKSNSGVRMNESFHSADRATHLKVVGCAVIAGAVVTTLLWFSTADLRATVDDAKNGRHSEIVTYSMD